MLDNAYLSVRYENNYHITERQILYLVDKAHDIQEMFQEACESILEAFGHALNTATD